MKTKINKTKEVRNHLLKGKTITSLQAFQFWNATRLSSIIFNLRRQGLNITSTDVEIDGVKFSRYKWVKKGSGVWNG